MIRVYVNDIRNSLKNKCYFSALSLALTLPDICGMVEYPDATVGGRYMDWYDKYIGEYMYQNNKKWGIDNHPYISGEIIYSLRNTFLHQGSPNINAEKMKKQSNKLDQFILILGDGTVIQAIGVDLGVKDGKALGSLSEKTGASIDVLEDLLSIRKIAVDITYLCGLICDCALWYYENNMNKFSWELNIVMQDDICQQADNPNEIRKEDYAAKWINEKLEKAGCKIRVEENPDRTRKNMEEIVDILSDEKMRQTLGE